MKNPTLAHSFKKALDGLIYSLRKERHVQLAIVIAVAVLIVGIFLKLSLIEYVVLFFAITFVLIAELLNTALEHTIDIVTQEYHPLAKIAKDISAAAVLVSIINAIIVAIFILVSTFRTR